MVRAFAPQAVAFTFGPAPDPLLGLEPEPEPRGGGSAPSLLRIRVVTWNVGEHDLAAGTITPADLRSLLQPAADAADASGGTPDLIAVGLQEVEMSAEAFGANVMERVGDAVRELEGAAEPDASKLRKIETVKGEAWARALAAAAGELGYREVAVQQMMGVFLGVFVRSDRYGFISDVVPQTVGCGTGLSSGVDGFANGIEKVMGAGSRLGGLIAGARGLAEDMRGIGLPETGNKGACGIRMMMHGQSLVLVAAHLAAGHKQISRRESDWRHIEKSLRFDPQGEQRRREKEAEAPPMRTADISAFFGDLNYRCELPPEETAAALTASVEQDRQAGLDSGSEGSCVQGTVLGLLAHDQLCAMRERGDGACDGWLEAPVTFAPTYKYTVGSDDYDIAPPKARSPSWTDRILFQSAGGGSGGSRLAGRGYSARHEAAWRVSDHRPVTLLLEAALPTAEQQRARDLRVLGTHLTPAVR